MAALSEVLWSKKENKNREDFEKRLAEQFKRYDLWKANYSSEYMRLKATVLPTINNTGVLWKVESKSTEAIIINFGRSDSIWMYTQPQLIERNTVAYAYQNKSSQASALSQKFYFNNATGKQITLATSPSKNYPGDGAFTLVNGVQNEKGLARSREFLGWSGDDLEAVIDLGSTHFLSNVVIHSLSSGASWIYPPQYAEVFISTDGQNFSPAGKNDNFEKTSGSNGVISILTPPVSARYIKILVKNIGAVPEGKPGAGNKAWLFVDEIEVN
jgi:hexosaminidase